MASSDLAQRGINPFNGERYRSWGKEHLDDDVVTLARARTREVFDAFDHVAVSFSGGKDSTAVLNIALDIARERGERLRVIFWDEEAIAPQTEDYVRRVAQRPDVDLEWYCLPVRHRNACSRRSPWWWPWASEDEAKWVRPLPPEAITSLTGFPNEPPDARPTIPDATGLLFPASLGRAALLMGIRAQESLVRERALLVGLGDRSWVKPMGGSAHANVFKVYPVYDWKVEDIWMAVREFGWDHNEAYDLMMMAGEPPNIQRCSPAFGEEPLMALWKFAVAFPDVWERMSERVPGANTAIRYARTELWSFKSKPKKPAGWTWPRFILHYLDMFRPSDAAMIAGRIQNIIRSHYTRTKEPPVEYAPHPASGLSWQFLLTIASRGDFKYRKNAKRGNWSPEEYAAMRKAYDDEAAAIKAAGRWEEILP